MYTSALILLAASALAAPLIERDNVEGHWVVTCESTFLDQQSTNDAYAALQNWATGDPVISSGDHNEAQIFSGTLAFAYACTDDHNGSNGFSMSDVRTAFKAMDPSCARYQASWAIWQQTNSDGTRAQNTGKIVGKDVNGAQVCQGYNGN